jgi:hypothetical protein
MLRKLLSLAGRVLAAVVLALIIMLLPPPAQFPAWVGQVQVGGAVFFLVCYIGKLLYDTLFYDHYSL